MVNGSLSQGLYSEWLIESSICGEWFIEASTVWRMVH